MLRSTLAVVTFALGITGCAPDGLLTPGPERTATELLPTGVQLTNGDAVTRLYSLVDSETYTRIDPHYGPGAGQLRLEPGESRLVPYASIEGYSQGGSTAIVVTSWTGSVLSLSGQWIPQNLERLVVPLGHD